MRARLFARLTRLGKLLDKETEYLESTEGGLKVSALMVTGMAAAYFFATKGNDREGASTTQGRKLSGFPPFVYYKEDVSKEPSESNDGKPPKRDV